MSILLIALSSTPYVYIFVCVIVGQEGKCDNLIKFVFEMLSSSEMELN